MTRSVSPHATRLRLVLALALAAGLAACDGGGSKDFGAINAPPPAPPAPQEDFFGIVFGQAFRAASTAEPIDPQVGNIIPVDPTRDPVGLQRR